MATVASAPNPLTERKFLNNDVTADLLGISRRTLPVWRVHGKGPKYIKVGKLVRYDEADVLAYIEANTRTSTSGGDDHGA